jgi:hypothetical protein
MSVDIQVFLHESALPTRQQWQSAIQAAGHNFVFDDFSPAEQTGFLPTRLDNIECGFEYSFNLVDDDEFEDLISVIGDRRQVATFTWHSNMLEMRAAQIAASVLADISRGLFYDPQSGNYAEGSAAYSLMADEREAERERKLAEAERKWEKVTERRCPECDARCPEYRGSCWVCGFSIGKLPA